MERIKAVTFFKALSDPTRLKLVMQLRDADALLCVCDLTQQLDQPQSTISRHLSHLRKTSIVICERRGTWIWYAINPDLPTWCLDIINATQFESDEPLTHANVSKNCC